MLGFSLGCTIVSCNSHKPSVATLVETGQGLLLTFIFGIIYSLMKALIAILLALSFVGLAVFGFWLTSQTGHLHSSCVVASIQGRSICPETAGLLGLVNFHIDALKTFSLAVLGSVAILALFFTFARIFLGLKAPFAYFNDLSKTLIWVGRWRFKSLMPLLKDQFNFWISLHEKSPAVI